MDDSFLTSSESRILSGQEPTLQLAEFVFEVGFGTDSLADFDVQQTSKSVFHGPLILVNRLARPIVDRAEFRGARRLVGRGPVSQEDLVLDSPFLVVGIVIP
jgi:hypothetical protein